MTPLYSPWAWRLVFISVFLTTAYLVSMALDVMPDVSCTLK